MIKLQGVSKFFNKGKRNEIRVIDNTTLDLGSKGLVALLGPSGSGKTTLLNAMGGLDRVNKGDIFVDGQRITRRSTAKIDKIRTLNIGYIFQDYKLVDNMTVYDNVAMALKMIGIKDEAEIKKRIDYILETLNIYRYRNRMADTLSGGERQRVGIARAIAKDPKIIIADEPTGNLDSANTIEIMNIIKAISRDRLVVLVTHEVSLAKFYASRIIEIKDGKVVNDYENAQADNLDYRIDNKFYLKDFEKHEAIKDEFIDFNFYGDRGDNLSIDVVIKGSNIYIKTKDNKRVEVVDNHSAIEFIDDHYKEMDKSFYENYSFDFHNVINNNFKEKYSSIIGFFPALLRGFKKIARYSVPKKLLFIGFVLAGIFTTYSLSSIYASLDVKDKDFITSNSNYLYVDIPSIDVSKYLEYEQLDSVSHMFPIKSNIGMNLNMGFYYQTANAQATISGDLTDVADITETDLVYGRMPENEYEIVVDQFAIERMLDVSSAKQVGISKVEDVLNKKVSIDNLKDFVIVGITNKSEPVIYAAPSMFIDMAYNGRSTHNANDGDFNFDYSFEQSGGSEKNIFNYATYDKAYTLKKGRLPENDYEIIVNNSMSETMPLNKTIDQKINGNKLKVVGYYTSPENMEVYLANGNTIKYSMITEAKGFSVAPADKELAMEQLTEDGLNVVSSYEKDKTTYMESRSQSNESTIIFGVIMLAISLIEVLLMTRSSFLSRIKEIGIFRAIGVKKTDIYKMFLGEIFAITTVSSLVGVCIMSYILYHLCKITAFANMMAINPVVFFGSIIILYVFNIIVGMLPVFSTMRKTPAAISARYDVD